jgi:hypothetical protein
MGHCPVKPGYAATRFFVAPADKFALTKSIGNDTFAPIAAFLALSFTL